jgi:glycogen debranching enzyme
VIGPGRTDPDLVSLFRGWSCLTTAPHGEIPGGRLQGFFAAGTLLMDFYRITVDGRTPRCTFSAPLAADRWSGIFIVPDSAREGDLPPGTVPRGSLEMTIDRQVNGAWMETLTVRNNASEARPVEVVLEWKCPVADPQSEESRSKDAPKVERAGLRPIVRRTGGLLGLRYERRFGRRRRAPTDELRRLLGKDAPKDGDPVERSLEIRLSARPATRPRIRVIDGDRTRLVFRRRMPARGAWTLRMELLPIVDGFPLTPWTRPPSGRTRIQTGNADLNQILSTAAEDLEALELPALGPPGSVGRIPPALIAGVPRYIGVFGRDLLTAGWQASLLSVRYLEDALSRTAMYAGVKRDDWRDEEPDRILHERRWNPNAALGRSNRELYYGDVAATPFWIITLASAYNWTGERSLLERHAGTLEACTRWVRRKLLEGAGFVTYDPRSTEPNRNQGWKDSGDAIVDARGRVHVPPLAVAEVQGYCFLALLAAAELALARRDAAGARELYREAMDLRKRFNEAFWMPRERFFAMALDGRGRRVDGIGSNAGHCLGCGIIDREKAPHVAARLLSPEMFSGWGIRTLSSDNPAYDPFSYHRGSVWPVENGTISAGLRLCGFHDDAVRVIAAQLAAAAWFPGLRLPEVLSGHARTPETPVPGLYPEANLLQAWSVSSVLFFLWVLLGLRPVAPLRTLLVKPVLPGLPWVELSDLRVGESQVSLAFWRTDRGEVRWKILEKKGRLFVLEQPLELDPAATVGRRLRDLARSVI